MVKIRLRRTGKTKQPSYRLVVADSRSPRDGRFVEIVGHYNPIRIPKVLEINAERVRYWLSVGAQPSDTVASLLKRQNILDGDGKVVAAPVEA
jgi:small subunit ribosomal protein S16